MKIDLLVVFFRWLHVITACVVIGCTVFMRLLLPVGLRGMDAVAQEAVFLRCRRALKFVVHGGILLLLMSGIYNAIANWGLYNQWPPAAHSLFGIHVLCALIAWAILLVFLARQTPFKGHRTWTLAALVVLAIAVAAGSALKSAREAVLKGPPSSGVQSSRSHS